MLHAFNSKNTDDSANISLLNLVLGLISFPCHAKTEEPTAMMLVWVQEMIKTLEGDWKWSLLRAVKTSTER